MQRAILLLSIITICVCFELVEPNDHPFVSSSSLTYYADQRGEYLLSFGGESNLIATSALWKFSISNKHWEEVPSNGAPALFMHSAILRSPSNSLLVFGGFVSSETIGILTPNTNMYEYFPANNTWTIIDDSFSIPSDFSANYLESEDALLVLSAQYPDKSLALQIYFLNNKTWSAVPAKDSIPYHTLVNSVYVPETETIYSIGGFYNAETVIAQFASLSIKTNNSWEYLENPGPIADSVLVASYPYIYSYGGCHQFQFSLGKGVFCASLSSDLMKYNIISNEWTVEDTSVPKTEALGVLTPNKVLYVYGGKNIDYKVVDDLQYLELEPVVINVVSGDQKGDSVGVIVASVVVGLLAIGGFAIFIRKRQQSKEQDLSTVPLVSKSVIQSV